MWNSLWKIYQDMKLFQNGSWKNASIISPNKLTDKLHDNYHYLWILINSNTTNHFPSPLLYNNVWIFLLRFVKVNVAFYLQRNLCIQHFWKERLLILILENTIKIRLTWLLLMYIIISILLLLYIVKFWWSSIIILLTILSKLFLWLSPFQSKFHLTKN